MFALSSMQYPHWLLIVGALLLVLGFVGLALRQRGVTAEGHAVENDQKPPEPESDLDQAEIYNRATKEKRKDRWAERFGEEPLDAESKT